MLSRLKDFYPNYQEMTSDKGFDLSEMTRFDVYAQSDKAGSVDDVLVDSESGKFRYYVVDTGFWVFGKKILLPVGLGRIDTNEKRIYVNSLTKQQVENLPNFDDLEKVDFDQEEQVRGIYRSPSAGRRAEYDRDTYQYDHDSDLYNLSDRDNQFLKLYEERLIADKQRQKVGQVQIGKRVETETARASVPVEKERVIIERSAPTENTAIDPGKANFKEGEVARMEVYEENPDIHKEAFVREEVQVRKEVDRDLVDAQEEIRREELDLDTQGRPTVDKQR